MSIQETFALERGDVLHHRRLAGESKMTLDFAGARRNSFLPLFALDKIQNISLALSEHVLMIVERNPGASSNEQVS